MKSANSAWKLPGLDLRSLTLFRVLLAIIVLVDLGLRATNMVAHYTDEGILPREALREAAWQEGFWSLNMLSGDLTWQICLWCIGAIAAISLLFGYYKTIALLISWAVLVSIQMRNPLIINAGDTSLRLMLFWSLFLPLHLPVEQPSNQPSLTLGGIAYLIQLSCIYLFAAWLKDGMTWQNGEAVYYALSLDMHVTPLGKIVLQCPGLTKILTWGTLYLERFGWILFWIPFFQPMLRSTALILFGMMHVGFAFTLNLGLFPYISVLGLIPLIPSSFWRNGIGSKVEALLLKISVKRTSIKIFSLENKLFDRLRNAVIIAAISLVVTWNLSTVNINILPTSFDKILVYSRLIQYWNLFAPDPIRSDGWYIVQAEHEDGMKSDLLHPEKQLSWEKPQNFADRIPNARWRKYMKNIKFWEYRPLRPYWINYYCKREQNIEEIKIYFMQELTPPPDELGEIKKGLIWKESCNTK